MEDKLLPCPFCGGAAKYYDDDKESACCTGEYCPLWDHMPVKKWNTRAETVSKLPSEADIEKVIRKFKKTYFEGVRGEVTYCVDGVIAEPLAKAIHNCITGGE